MLFTLNDEDKKIQHEKILQYAENFGGKNFFLNLLETIRETKPHPLIAGNSEFNMELGSIKWNKVIFNDKLQLLQKARINETKQNNFLPLKDEKNYKKVLNLVRTLKPIVFHVRPANKEDGSGFFFQAFDIIDEDTTKLNPIFDALFFCSVDNVKRALNYRVKD
jgi:flagellar biosynthesis/type III secretory pathway chaperone